MNGRRKLLTGSFSTSARPAGRERLAVEADREPSVLPGCPDGPVEVEPPPSSGGHVRPHVRRGVGVGPQMPGLVEVGHRLVDGERFAEDGRAGAPAADDEDGRVSSGVSAQPQAICRRAFWPPLRISPLCHAYLTCGAGYGSAPRESRFKRGGPEGLRRSPRETGCERKRHGGRTQSKVTLERASRRGNFGPAETCGRRAGSRSASAPGLSGARGHARSGNRR